MRVFQLIKSLDRGGAEVLLSEVLKRTPRDVKVAFGYFSPERNMMVGELERQGASVTCFSAATPAAMFRALPDVARHLRAWKPDVVHCHLPLAGVVGRLAASLSGIPVVYTEHNVLERYHPLTRAAALSTWHLQRRVIAVSGDVAASIRNVAGERIPVDLVRNAVVVEAFERDEEAAARTRAELGIPAGAPVIGSVAVFRPAKRLDLWLEVARAVLDRRPDAHFVLVGYGPLDEEVRRRRRELGLEERVHLPGSQSDVRRFLSAMDVYLMSSDFEGLPVALLEAMAMRLPVVVTSVGGIPEAVDETCGRLGPPGNCESLVAAVLELVDDPCLRAELGAAARDQVERRFGMERMVADIQAVYERAIC